MHTSAIIVCVPELQQRQHRVKTAKFRLYNPSVHVVVAKNLPLHERVRLQEHRHVMLLSVTASYHASDPPFCCRTVAQRRRCMLRDSCAGRSRVQPPHQCHLALAAQCVLDRQDEPQLRKVDVAAASTASEAKDAMLYSPLVICTACGVARLRQLVTSQYLTTGLNSIGRTEPQSEVRRAAIVQSFPISTVYNFESTQHTFMRHSISSARVKENALYRNEVVDVTAASTETSS